MTSVSMRSRGATGQAMVEYLVVTGVLVVALGIGLDRKSVV